MNHARYIVSLGAILASITIAHDASAALITPTGVTSSSDFSGTWPSILVINNSGLSGPVGLSSTHATNSSGSPNGWVAASGANEFLIFDLGGSFSLSDVHIWNYALPSPGADGGVNQTKDITVSFSTTGTGGAFSGGQNFSLAIDNGTTVAQSFGLGGVTANAVRIDLINIHAGSIAGISEVKLSGVQIPAPAGLPAGLALLAIAATRRRRR